MFIYNGIKLYVQNLLVNNTPYSLLELCSQVQYYVFQKLMKSFWRELFISKYNHVKIFFFIMHTCILLNDHVMPPSFKQFKYSVL